MEKINNIAELKQRVGIANSNISLLGYYSAGDGGGGEFYWDSTSTETDNGGTIIQVSGVTTGRWKRIYNNIVNVLWFGVSNNEGVDATAKIQSILDSFNDCLIPKGNYRIDGTLNLNIVSQKLLIEGNLYRKTVNTNSTSPIIKISAQKVSLKGTGNNVISCENNTPFGLILIGTENITSSSTQANILWCEISGFNIIGNSNVASVGIDMNSIEAFGSSQANYSNTIYNNLIQNVGVGVRMNSQCNGNIITNIQFFGITKYAIFLDGTTYGASQSVSGNSISSIFVHFSSSILSIIRCQRAIYNNFIDVNGEAGGGNLYNFDLNSINNTLIGTDNQSLAPVDSGTNQTFVNGVIRSNEINSKKATIKGSVFIDGENQGISIDASNLTRFGIAKFPGYNTAFVHGNTIPMVFGQVTGASIFSGTTFVEQMRIAIDGNVGINKSNPQSKFAVYGLNTFSSNSAAISAGLTAGDFYIRSGHGLDIVV